MPQSITSRRGRIVSLIQGPNGPQVVMVCTQPNVEGTYVVELAKPGDEWNFEVNPDGTAYLESRSRVKLAGVN